jgi:hypothetical protein
LAYFGVRISRDAVIEPTAAADLMTWSYVASPPKARWMSDYTYRALFNRFAVIGPISSPPQVDSTLTRADGVLLVSGFVTPTQGSAMLRNVYRLPQGTLSQARLAEQAARQSPSLAISAEESAAQGAGAAKLPLPVISGERAGVRGESYDLVLLDSAGAPLATQSFAPLETADASGAALTLMVVMPDDARAASLVLQSGAAVLARRSVSAHAPSVSVLAPAAGALVTDTLQAEWQASDLDGDSLHYIIQYSADLGATWQALATNWFTTTFATSSQGLPGSQGRSLLRVIATDGFNSAIAQSESFSLQDHAPQVHISAVRVAGSGAVFCAAAAGRMMEADGPAGFTTAGLGGGGASGSSSALRCLRVS